MRATTTNRMAKLAPLALFLSSYSPLFALITVRQVFSYSQYLNWCGFNKVAVWTFLKYYGVASLCVVAMGFGILGSIMVFKNIGSSAKNGHNVQLNEVSSMNDEPIAYLATYIIPIIFNDYSNLADVLTVGIIFYITYRLYIRSKMVLVNPVLGLYYSIYSFKYMDGNVSRQGILITKYSDILEEDKIKIYPIGYQLFYGYRR